MNEPKEIPILFKGDMVRAILEGRKTQTRRPLNPQPLLPQFSAFILDNKFARFFESLKMGGVRIEDIRNKWGKPGDILWVRETFCPVAPPTPPGEEIPDWANYIYRADLSAFEACPLQFRPNKWKPSIFMPKDACRLFLEILTIRVERLQDITEEDALAEGIEVEMLDYPKGVSRPVIPATQLFAQLWEDINGPGTWDENPWVWVITFKKHKTMNGETIRTEHEKAIAVAALMNELQALGAETLFGENTYQAYTTAVQVIQEDKDGAFCQCQEEEVVRNLCVKARDWLKAKIPLTDLVQEEHIPQH